MKANWWWRDVLPCNICKIATGNDNGCVRAVMCRCANLCRQVIALSTGKRRIDIANCMHEVVQVIHVRLNVHTDRRQWMHWRINKMERFCGFCTFCGQHTSRMEKKGALSTEFPIQTTSDTHEQEENVIGLEFVHGQGCRTPAPSACSNIQMNLCTE